MTAATAPTRRRRQRRIRKVWLSLVGLLLAAFFLAPYSVMLLDAVRPNDEIERTPPHYWPSHWHFSIFSDILGQQAFRNWLKSSLIISLSATLIVVVVAIPAAYYTARRRFPGRAAFLFLVLITQMFAPTSLVVGIYREFFEANLVDTYLAIIVVDAAFNLAFAIWILHGFFSSIPVEVEEAAQLDGAGRLGTLMRIMLPLTLPGLVTAVIFTFIAAWNEYVVALILIQTDSRKPLTVGISNYVTQYTQHWNELMAASLIAIVPVVILFAVIERYLVGGLTAGSVK